MNNFYKITKYAGFFKIKRKYYYFPILELSCKKYSKIFQHKHAIIAKLVTGGYDLYLPSTKYDSSSHKYEVVNRPLTLVASNISEYLPYQDIFAFKKDSAWIFLFLDNFEMELELDGNITNSLEKRLSELPRIPCEVDTAVSFKPGFESIYNSLYDNNHHLAIFSANKDYLINAAKHSLPLYSSGIEINCLGLVTKLSGGNGHFFKATYDEGESWYHDQYFDGITYGSIEPMNETESPSIYPNKDFSGYWKKNHDGFIMAFAFLSNSDHTSFSFRLPCPAKEVQFMKTISQVNLYDGTDMVQPATLWKITSMNDEEIFLLVSDNHYVTMSLQDFIN